MMKKLPIIRHIRYFIWKMLESLRFCRSRPENLRWFAFLPVNSGGMVAYDESVHRTKLDVPVKEQFEIYEDTKGQALLLYPRSSGKSADIFPDLATARSAAQADFGKRVQACLEGEE